MPGPGCSSLARWPIIRARLARFHGPDSPYPGTIGEHARQPAHRYQARTRAAQRAAPAGLPVPQGLPARSGQRRPGPAGHRVHRTPGRGVRGRLFLARMPAARPGSGGQRVVLVTEVRRNLERDRAADAALAAAGWRVVRVWEHQSLDEAAACLPRSLCLHPPPLPTCWPPVGGACDYRPSANFPSPLLALPDPERRYELDALGAYPGVELFLERARAARPDFRLSEANAGAVGAICARVDGLPLAIELAAARVRLLSPAEIVPRLAHPFELLTGGPRDKPPRHRTLGDTISWSLALLDRGARTMFTRLGVFAGGFTVEAAEAVAGDPGAAGGYRRPCGAHRSRPGPAPGRDGSGVATEAARDNP